MGEQGLKHFGKALGHNHTVVHVKIQGSFYWVFVCVLVVCMCGYCSDNNEAGEGLHHLGKAFETNRTVTHLEILGKYTVPCELHNVFMFVCS